MERENIKHFALEVLGCGCNHSVFDSIEVTDDVKLQCGVRLTKKILIGKRLLIYVTPEGCCAPGEVGAVIAEGMAERDSSGYNRLRLVIVAPDAAVLSGVYSEAFARVQVKDEKCHIHIVRPEDAL